jgi:alpha-D-xyloside xylohydrolase
MEESGRPAASSSPEPPEGPFLLENHVFLLYDSAGYPTDTRFAVLFFLEEDMRCPDRSVIPFILVHFMSCIIFPIVLKGEEAQPIPVLKAEKKKDGVLFDMKPGLMKLQVWDDGVVRVVYTSGDRFSARKSLAVVKPSPDPVPWSLAEGPDRWIFKTRKVRIDVLKKSGAVFFFDAAGRILLAEPESGGKSLTAAVVLGENCFHAEQFFHFSHDEGIYGFGGHQDGVMNYNGSHVRLVQENMVDVTPVFTSTNGYGILWDNASATEFRGEKRPGSLWSEVADQIDYYFLYGPELDQVISEYRDLTGPAPMFGRWAYGYWQSKEHYHTQQQVLDAVAGYRERRLPLDVIVQDWFYWNPKPWGSHTFDRERYPDPEGMIKTIHEKYNAKVMISVWGKFDPGSPNHAELAKSGYLYKPLAIGHPFGSGTQYYDAFNPSARKMYWKQMRDSLYAKGIDAWWLDATEPEIGDLTKDEDKAIMNNFLGTGARNLNAYSLMTTEAVYKGQRAETSAKRVCMLTRSVFAGQQRNAAVTWSGDTDASWEVFRNQITDGLNFCMSGVPYWTTDNGAFSVSQYIGGAKNDEYRELYTRWFQFSTFSPVMRSHGTSTPREIWQFGDPGSWAYETLARFDRLRYRMLPYIYSLAWKVTDEGYTMMRGLPFDFRNDPAVRSVTDQYMFGPAFLVNPVTRVMYHPDPVMGNIGAVVPASRFVKADGKTPGLSADYFLGSDFEKPVLSRVDTAITFDWGIKSPAPEIRPDSFSVRWTGRLLTGRAGKYRFTTLADDGVRLWVGGNLVLEDWHQHAPEYHSGEVDLPANSAVDFRFEFYEAIGGASVKLNWTEPKTAEELAAEKELDPNAVQTRPVVLPRGTAWTDFWTGKNINGGKTIPSAAPIDIIPLYVRAGSMVPLGPVLQYAVEKPEDPIELRVYPGADGQFVLYEDENDNYDYEKGVYAVIPLTWNDAKKTLVIGDRQGSFPGMPAERTFQVVIVREAHGTGVDVTPDPDKTVLYSGKRIEVKP